jgi:hypothetical protein
MDSNQQQGQETADAEIELRRLPLNQMLSNVYCWSSWLGDEGYVRPNKYPSKEITNAVVSFERNLAKSKEFEVEDYINGVVWKKSGNGVHCTPSKEKEYLFHCVICRLFIKYPKSHIRTVSHRRRKLCILLMRLGHIIMRFSPPSFESLNELHALLETRKNPKNEKAVGADAFLLSTQGKNWSCDSNTGPNGNRGGGIKDFSKIWFLEFLKLLRQRCIALKSPQDMMRLVLFEKIIAAVDMLYLAPNPRAPKRQNTGPSAQV